MNRRHVEFAEAAFDVAAMPVRVLQQRMLDPAFSDDKSDSEAIAMVDRMLKHVATLTELERRSRGLAATEVSGSGLSAPAIDVTAEWLGEVYSALHEAGITAPSPAARVQALRSVDADDDDDAA